MTKKRLLKPPVALIFEFILIILILTGGIFFLRSDFFSARFIDCTKDGFICLSNDLVLFNSLLGKNIIFINTKQASELLLPKKIEYKEINIERKLPNSLRINIVTRKPQAQFIAKNGSFFIDETGFIFSSVYQIKEKIPVIIAPSFESGIIGNYASQNTQKALELAAGLDYAYLPFKNLTIKNDGDIIIAGNGWEAWVSPKKDFDSQVSSLQLILRSSTIGQDQKIDLRFEKPVVSLIYE